MKSLQNKYNLIKEGKGNKELFLKEAKALFPNVVTNALTFDQAIHNLSERGIISEALVFGGIAQPTAPDWFKVFKESTGDVKAELKKTDKEVEEAETKGFDYKDKKNNNNISTAEILSGYYVEMKDPKNAEKTETEIKAMVFKNLEKDPLHYVKEGQFGVKELGYKDEAPGLGQPKEATGKYKSSGMEPVKLNESKHSDEADLKIYKSELNMLNKIKPTGEKQLKRKAELEKKIADLEKKMTEAVARSEMMHQYLKHKAREAAKEDKEKAKKEKAEKAKAGKEKPTTEVFYGSSDGDYDAQEEDKQMAYYNYDKGMEAYSEGDYLKADRYYTTALRYGSYVGFTEADLPPYGDDMNESLNEGYGMTLVDAMKQAYEESLNGYVQHVEDNGDGTFKVTDWYDSDNTVVSFEDGRKFNDRTAEYDLDEIDITGVAGSDEEDDWREGARGVRRPKPKQETLSEAKRKAVEKHLKEIEKLGEIASVAHKIQKINEKIEELNNKLTMTEGDDVKDMVDKKAVKEIQKDIKLYEKKKAFYEKMHSKMSKKAGVEPMEEEVPIMEADDDKPKFHDPEGDKIRSAMKRDTGTKLRPWSEIVKDILKDKVPGTSK